MSFNLDVNLEKISIQTNYSAIHTRPQVAKKNSLINHLKNHLKKGQGANGVFHVCPLSLAFPMERQGLINILHTLYISRSMTHTIWTINYLSVFSCYEIHQYVVFDVRKLPPRFHSLIFHFVQPFWEMRNIN